jgi:hypothetical protein
MCRVLVCGWKVTRQQSSELVVGLPSPGKCNGPYHTLGQTRGCDVTHNLPLFFFSLPQESSSETSCESLDTAGAEADVGSDALVSVAEQKCSASGALTGVGGNGSSSHRGNGSGSGSGGLARRKAKGGSGGGGGGSAGLANGHGHHGGGKQPQPQPLAPPDRPQGSAGNGPQSAIGSGGSVSGSPSMPNAGARVNLCFHGESSFTSWVEWGGLTRVGAGAWMAEDDDDDSEITEGSADKMARMTEAVRTLLEVSQSLSARHATREGDVVHIPI